MGEEARIIKYQKLRLFSFIRTLGLLTVYPSLSGAVNSVSYALSGAVNSVSYTLSGAVNSVSSSIRAVNSVSFSIPGC